MLRPRLVIPCVTVCAALAGACNLTPSATTGASDTDTSSGTTDGTSDGTESTTQEQPTTSDGPGTTTNTTPGTTTNTTPGTTTESTTEGTTTEGTTTGPDLDDVTIYDIQGGKIPENSVVTVKGVVITSPLHVEDGITFVQEPDGGEMSGIALFLYDEVAMTFPVKPGIMVDITAEYVEFFGESQLKVTTIDGITQVGEGEPPAPEVVADPASIATGGANAEAYEGVLVAVENVTVTNPSIDIGEFEVESSLRISDYFLFPENMSPKPAMGQVYQSIAGPLRFSFDNNKVAPRSADDLTSEVMPGEEHTIYEIQQGMVPLLSNVIVKGAVVTSPLTFKKDGFFIQDPMGGEYSGIYVYINMNVVDVKPGDVVDIEGQYDEYFDFSQIKVTDAAKVVKNGMGAVPAPEVVAAADVAAGGMLQENYEGVLVTVENVQVAAVNDMFGEYELSDGLFVDDLFFANMDWTLPMVGDMFMSLTGPLAFSFDEAKLSPRDANDIVK